ncbi:hybrid sensor histidine kinase/response regulator [Leptolyngbya ohadii]|uniref:hybrid sensor histidine kinase/response regulator n=1 Tax=Leptolyngbya ohadii TaxID=1962290 RepID=UPI000B59FB72|nr:ATP-binding protein [Leptolyngbya ohadii]
MSSLSPKADILVIDDKLDNLNLLSAMLVEQGYKVRSVTKGSTGLRGAQAMPPDLILLDINMPEMNGYEVCQQLKANPLTREIPVLFISALEDVLDKVKAFSVGGVDYITKPFQVAEVLARIETHLTLRRLQQQLQAQNVQLQQEVRERQRAEEKFTRAFRSSPTPIAIATLSENRFIEVNSSFLNMIGYTLEEVIGHTGNELRLGIHLDDYEQTVRQIEKTGTIYNLECDFHTKSGEIKTVLLSVELIDLAGVPCTLNLIHDITERKRLENEFISLVSHELRTPMTALLGSLDLLSAGGLGQLTDRGKKVVQIATSNTERLIRLVNDILDLERMKSGKLTLQKTECNIADILTQATEAMQFLADRSQIKLITQPINAVVQADPDRLLQTFTNLLGNAIKFSPAGGTVWLRVELWTGEGSGWVDESMRGRVKESKSGQEYEQLERNEARKTILNPSPSPSGTPSPTYSPIHPSTHPPIHPPTHLPTYLLFTLQDQGRGIPPHKLHQIFEPFQQVDVSDSRQKGGTGLGLAICRNIIEQHGGKIWAESVFGEGSTFYISLPIAGGLE